MSIRKDCLIPWCVGTGIPAPTKLVTQKASSKNSRALQSLQAQTLRSQKERLEEQIAEAQARQHGAFEKPFHGP